MARVDISIKKFSVGSSPVDARFKCDSIVDCRAQTKHFYQIEYHKKGAIMKSRYLVLATALTLILTAPAIACDMCKKMLKNPEQSLSKQVDYISENGAILGLSPQQIEKVKSTFVDAKKDIIKLDADYRVAQLDLEATLQKDPLDVNAAKNLIDKSTKASAEKMKRSIEAQSNILKILTPEQKTKLKETCLSGKPEADNDDDDFHGMMKGKSMDEQMKMCPVMMKRMQDKETPDVKEQK